MIAKDIMTETSVVVPLDMLVADLAKLLREMRISGVPVMDGKKKICGIVTVTDLFKVMKIARSFKMSRNWFSHFRFSNKILTIKEIYTRRLIAVLPETPIEEVAGLMLDKNIHTIPVMNQDRAILYGVIGRHDVTAAALGLDTFQSKVQENASPPQTS